MLNGQAATERRASNPLLGPAEQAEHLRLSMILDQMPIGIGVFDSGGSLFHANCHFERAAGGAIPSLEAMQGQFWRAAPTDGSTTEDVDHPAVRALNGHVATPGVDFIRQTIDGHDHWVSISAVPLTGADSSAVVGVVVVVEEAECRRRAAARLRAKEERFRRFAKYSSNALWIADLADGRIEFLSPAAASFWTGLAEEDHLDALAGIIHPDDLARTMEHRRDVARGHVKRFEYRIVDGQRDTVRHVREISFLIPDEYGSADCVGGIVEDVSPEVQIYLVQGADQSAGLLDGLPTPARRIKTFACQEELMRIADVLNPGCVLIDLRGRHPDVAAIEALLSKRPIDLQVVFIGAAQTPTAQVLAAMRGGAIDYLLEPVGHEALENAITRACNALPSGSEPAAAETELASRFSHLPRREREVLEGLVAGGTNKVIARKLGISPRTVEVHRAHLMERLNVRNLSELLQIVHRAGLGGMTRRDG